MLEKLLEDAAARGLELDLRLRAREFSASFGPAARAAAARVALYPLLAALEDGFVVSVAGAPPCLMPDAAEHFTWPLGERGTFRRAPVCKTCSLLRCPGLNAQWARCSLLRPVLPAPAEIVLELNKRCNLACRACFGRSGETLQYRLAERALREAAALGVKSARFTGGEPLLYEGLPRLLRLAKKLGFYTLLNSNCSLLTPAKAKALRGLVDNALISVPGFDEKSHARACGLPGALAAKAAAVELLRRGGTGVVRAGTVVSSGLLKNLDRWRAAAGRFGFDLWELYRPMMTESSLAWAPEYRVRRADFVKLSARLARQGAGVRTVLANPVPLCALPAAARPYCLGGRFDDGWTRLVLDARGVWKPSYPSEKYLGPSLAGAWRHPHLLKTRDCAWLPARCKKCPLLPLCLGGSRFQAELAGDAFGPDPWMAK